MERAGDLLRRLFNNQDFSKGEKYASFFNSWEKMAGSDLAAHSHVADVRNGVVLVEVDHPGWMQLLQMKQERVLRSIRAAYPELDINAMRYRLVSNREHMSSLPKASAPEAPASEEEPDSAPEPFSSPGSAEKAAENDDAFQELLNRLEEGIRKRNEPNA